MGLNQSSKRLREKLQSICNTLISQGLPSREELEKVADVVTFWKRGHQAESVWDTRPLLVTATLDDGLGQGLSIIERFALVIGMDVRRIGLLQQPQAIIEHCRILQPEFVGLTILQLDSDDALLQVGKNLPAQTRLIAGGPVFKFDPDMAVRCGVDYVAPDVAHFIDYLIKDSWHKHDRSP